jgi:hypothetical protein
MEFKKYIGLWLYTIDGDNEHFYRAIPKRHELGLKVAKEFDGFIPYEDTDYRMAIGPNDCRIIKIRRLPFQIRIQECTKRRALEIIKFLVDLAIDCHEHGVTPSDIHEANILWWDRPHFIDLDAIEPLSHKSAALTYVRISYLLNRYVLERNSGSHVAYNLHTMRSHGGWMANQADTPDFTKPEVWGKFRKFIYGLRTPSHPDTHWSKNYAKSPRSELAKNPKIAKVLEMIPSGRTLLDVGCNKGYICNLLKDKFEYIFGFDADEPCIDMAFSEPNINFGHFGIKHLGRKEPISITDRFHADVVTALAVTHHFRDAKISWRFVADTLNRLTKKYLLIEDIILADRYAGAFKSYGFEIEQQIPSYPSGRTLTLWKRKEVI